MTTFEPLVKPLEWRWSTRAFGALVSYLYGSRGESETKVNKMMRRTSMENVTKTANGVGDGGETELG